MHRTFKSELGEVALAVLGLWLLVRFALQAVDLALSLEFLREGRFPLVLLFQPALYGLIGSMLVCFRRRLSLELFGADASANDVRSAVSPELNEFLVSLMGLWFICSGIIDAAETEQRSLLNPSVELSQSLYDVGRPRALVTVEAWIARAPYLTELVVGSVLFASSGRILDLWTRIRRAGHVK